MKLITCISNKKLTFAVSNFYIKIHPRVFVTGRHPRYQIEAMTSRDSSIYSVVFSLNINILRLEANIDWSKMEFPNLGQNCSEPTCRQLGKWWYIDFRWKLFDPNELLKWICMIQWKMFLNSLYYRPTQASATEWMTCHFSYTWIKCILT